MLPRRVDRFTTDIVAAGVIDSRAAAGVLFLSNGRCSSAPKHAGRKCFEPRADRPFRSLLQ